MIRSQQSYSKLPQGLQIVGESPRPRVPRRPQHNFNIVQYPYELTPFFISPVLSGETLKQGLMQARVVSTKLENRLIGGHIEHYFFYVKLRDLADREDIVKMLMDTGGSGMDLAGANNAYYYVKQNAPNWLKQCTDIVVTHYFRDEGDTGSHVGSISGLPMVMWQNKNSVFESLIADASLPTEEITDQQPLNDFDKMYAAYEFAKQMQLTEMSFEDYLGTFGVKLPTAEVPNKPELLRFCKNWTYPTNTVDGDGTINTQFSWSVMERLDKDRFFKEPGFIVGYTVFRPKVYAANRQQAAISILTEALDFLPATMKDMAYSSLKKFQANSALSPFVPHADGSDGKLDSDLNYWIDVRDLFVYGDAFTNRAESASNNFVRPEDYKTMHGKKYPSSAALQLIGVGDTLTCEQDGLVSLNILGTQIDMT